MKALISRQSIIIASAAVLLAVITIISVNAFSSPGPVTGVASAILRPIRQVTSTVTTVFERIYYSIYRYDTLMAAYEAAIADNAVLMRDFRDAYELARENDMLRTQLNFQQRYVDFESESANVIDTSSSNWSSSFTINRGYANSSIERGNAVISEGGVLIGQVSAVGATSSTVVTILDTTFSAGAFVGVGDNRATVKGDFNLMRQGLIMLDRIDDDQVVLPGDSVVTSGYGGVFPAGLIVGDVLEVQRHSTGVGRFATVRPTRVMDALSLVFVITGFQLVEQ